MAYSDDDGQSPGQSMLEQELTEAVIRSGKTINRYMDAKQKLAMKGGDPHKSPKLVELLNDVDVATLSAFDQMKPYCRKEMMEKWMDTTVGTWDGKPVVFGSEHDPDASDDELYLDEVRGMTTADQVTEHVRFEGEQTRIIHEPVLLDISAYIHVKDLLQKTMRESDLAPEPDTPGFEDNAVITHGDN